MQMAVQSINLSVPAKAQDLARVMRNMNLATDDGHLNLAGLLLFGEHPFGKTGLTYFPTSSASSMASLGMSSPAANGATSPTSGERSYQRSDNLGLTCIIT